MGEIGDRRHEAKFPVVGVDTTVSGGINLDFSSQKFCCLHLFF